jgi:hypothetical protein
MMSSPFLQSKQISLPQSWHDCISPNSSQNLRGRVAAILGYAAGEAAAG